MLFHCDIISFYCRIRATTFWGKSWQPCTKTSSTTKTLPRSVDPPVFASVCVPIWIYSNWEPFFLLSGISAPSSWREARSCPETVRVRGETPCCPLKFCDLVRIVACVSSCSARCQTKKKSANTCARCATQHRSISTTWPKNIRKRCRKWRVCRKNSMYTHFSGAERTTWSSLALEK